MDAREESTDCNEADEIGHGFGGRDNLLKAKMDELTRTLDEVKKAKDMARQSWINWTPLLDLLEKVKAELATEQGRSSVSAGIISELEAQLEATNSMIQAKKKQEIEASRRVDWLRQEIELTHGSIEACGLHIDERQRLRPKLRQLLRVRRQTLRSLSLALHATAAEAEAARAAAAETERRVLEEKTEETVQITVEEYHELKKRAAEENMLADWRVSMAEEQRAAVEASRRTAMTGRRPREEAAAVVAEGSEQGGDQDAIGKSGFQIARARARAEPNRPGRAREIGRTRNGRRKVVKKKKRRRKQSIFHQIKRFITKSISRLFR